MSRSIYTIVKDIRSDWKNVYFGAKPYLDAMSTLDSIDENYGCDSGKEMVLYFLSNSSSWRGEVARNIKKELKAIAGIK